MRFVATTVAALACGSFGVVSAQSQFTTNSLGRGWVPRIHAGAGSGSFSVNAYTYDDGVSENSLGLTGCASPNVATICWLHKFDAVGGSDTIVNVQTAWGTLAFPGGAPPAGQAASVGVWSDPNQDGDPSDAILLSSAATTIANPDTDILQVVPVPPTVVSGSFFVGAFTAQVCSTLALSQFPAPMDTTGASLGRAWVCANDPDTGFVTSPLGANNIPPVELDSINFPALWLLRAEGAGGAPTVYCTAKLTANGCTPSIGSSGSASATAGSGFFVNGTNFINNKNCLLFYGVTGQASGPFQGGTICVQAPIKRTPGTNTFGNPPPNDCSGVPQIDMNAYALTAGALLALQVPGTVVNCQWWGRDPGFTAPNNTQLSNGLQYTVGP